jgi:hypothetical protein
MSDLRKLLHASPPNEVTDRIGRTVTVGLDGPTYRALYDKAFDDKLSLSDALRQAIKEYTQ